MSLGSPRGQGRLSGQAFTPGHVGLAGEQPNGYSDSAVNLGLPNALSRKAAPRRGEVACSAQAEYALLGCVLIDDFEVWGELEELTLDAEDFFFPEHKAIWRAFRWLFEQGMEVTIPTTVYAMQQMGTLDAVDGWLGRDSYPGTETYLVELASASFSAKGCGAFMRIVKHYSAMRAPLATHAKWEIEID